MWKQRTLAFSNSVCDAACAALSEKVEVEGSGNKEPQPLVTQCAMKTALPLRKRLRLRGLETKNLSL